MFRNSKSLVLAAATSLFALTAGAYAEAPSIGEINVKAEISAPDGSNALELYPTLADDLKREIIARVKTSDDPTDPEIGVTIKGISLDGDTFLPDSAEFNEMEGIISYADGQNDMVLPLKVTAVTGEVAAAPGTIVIPPSSEEFYQAMLASFADQVAALVPDTESIQAKRN